MRKVTVLVVISTFVKFEREYRLRHHAYKNYAFPVLIFLPLSRKSRSAIKIRKRARGFVVVLPPPPPPPALFRLPDFLGSARRRNEILSPRYRKETHADKELRGFVIATHARRCVFLAVPSPFFFPTPTYFLEPVSRK